jgi:hypothetical protein
MTIESRHFDTDDLNGIVETWHFDHATGMQYLTAEQDVTDIVELNKAEMALSLDQRYGDGKRVARIPALVLEQWQRDGTLGPTDPVTGRAPVLDAQKLLRRLDDPSFVHLRTFRGRLSR